LTCIAGSQSCTLAAEEEDRRVGQHVYECPTARPPDGKTDGPPVTVREGLGFDPDGRLTWFDGSSGEVLAKEELRPEAAEALTRDVTYDPWQHRALVFESDAEDQGGAIAVHPMAATEPGFEARRHWAWVDGRARLMALPYALLSFEEGHGERWKVLRDDGVPTVSVAAPRPASAWLEPTGDGYRVAALVHQPTDDTTLRQ